MSGVHLISKIQQIAKAFAKGSTFDSVINKVRFVSASEGKVTCELTVEQEHTNGAGTLHGGLTATLVDGISTFAIISASHPPGVSTDLNVSYLRPAPLGQTVVINAECSKIGKTLAFTTVDISDKDTGKLIAQGRHTKYIAN